MQGSSPWSALLYELSYNEYYMYIFQIIHFSTLLLEIECKISYIRLLHDIETDQISLIKHTDFSR